MTTFHLSAPLELPGVDEGKNVYMPGGFHPVYLGDVFKKRYLVRRKLGFGQYSTIWLVQDLLNKGSPDEFKAMKVLSGWSYNEEAPISEREILIHLREADRSHPGYKFVCHLLDDFIIRGRNGSHVVLVFELMGENLRTFPDLFRGRMIPNCFMTKFTSQLLKALDYAHDNEIVHADIQPSNIFVKFISKELVLDFLKETKAPTQDRDERQYTPILSQPLRNFYFRRGERHTSFNVVLGDWGSSSWRTKNLEQLTQPVTFRAPEVLIGAQWDCRADLWSLGVAIFEAFRAVRMFSGKEAAYEPYQLKLHLAEIVSFYGVFNKAFLEKGRPALVSKFFDRAGQFKNSECVTDRELSSNIYMEGLTERDRYHFVSFLYALMRIDPEERRSPTRLLQLPWLSDEGLEE